MGYFVAYVEMDWARRVILVIDGELHGYRRDPLLCAVNYHGLILEDGGVSQQAVFPVAREEFVTVEKSQVGSQQPFRGTIEFFEVHCLFPDVLLARELG